MANDSFHDLMVFVQVAECGNFTAAARVLGFTPSTVSKVISRLESRFNARLFNRTTHYVRLSEEGRALYARAIKVIDAMREAGGLAEAFAASAQGQLRVHVMPSFAQYQLAPLLSEFLADNPKLRIDLELGTEPPDAMTAEFDVVVRYGRATDSTLISRKIADSNWVVCASPAYLERCGTPQDPEALRAHNCLEFSLRKSAVAWTFEPDGAMQGLSGNASSNHAPMLRELALAGLGIIRVADFVVAEDIAAGKLVPVLAEFTVARNEPIYALYQRQPEGSQRVRAFVNFLHQKFSRWRSGAS